MADTSRPSTSNACLPSPSTAEQSTVCLPSPSTAEHSRPSTSTAEQSRPSTSTMVSDAESCSGSASPSRSLQGCEDVERQGLLTPEAVTPRQEGRQSGLRVMVSMFKYVVGTGLLGHALAMRDLGIVGYFVVASFFCVLSIWGNYLLGYTLDAVGRTDLNMAELGGKACGRFGFALASTMYFCDNFGGIIAYLKALASIMQPLLRDEHALGPHSRVTEEWALILIFAAAIYPLTLYRRMESLGWVLALGSLGIAAFVLSVVGYAAAHPGASLAGVALLKTDLDAAVALPVIAFSFDCQCNVFPNYRELDAQKGAKGARLGSWSAAALVAAFCCCSLVATCGLAAFRGDLDEGGNLLDSFSNRYAVLKVLVFASVIPDIPLNCFEGTRILQDHVFGVSRASGALIPAGLMGAGAGVAIALPSVYAAFGYVGAVASMSLTTVIPPLFFICATRRARGGSAAGDALLAGRDDDAAPVQAPPRWMSVVACVTGSIGACVVPIGVVLTYLGS